MLNFTHYKFQKPLKVEGWNVNDEWYVEEKLLGSELYEDKEAWIKVS